MADGNFGILKRDIELAKYIKDKSKQEEQANQSALETGRNSADN